MPDDMFNKPDEKAKSDWEILKESLLEELNLNREIFEYQYQSFLIGLRLKTLPMCSKKEFSIRSNLSLSKINQIEDYCFLAKVNDIFMYVKKGLGQEFFLQNLIFGPKLYLKPVHYFSNSSKCATNITTYGIY